MFNLVGRFFKLTKERLLWKSIFNILTMSFYWIMMSLINMFSYVLNLMIPANCEIFLLLDVRDEFAHNDILFWGLQYVTRGRSRSITFALSDDSIIRMCLLKTLTRGSIFGWYFTTQMALLVRPYFVLSKKRSLSLALYHLQMRWAFNSIHICLFTSEVYYTTNPLVRQSPGQTPTFPVLP